LNIFLKLAVALHLVEEYEHFDQIHALPPNTLVIPKDCTITGSISADFDVLLAGRLNGTLRVSEGHSLRVLEGATLQEGQICADSVNMSGHFRDVNIDTNVLTMDATSSIEGNSIVLYQKLIKHEDADLNGRISVRKTPRGASLEPISLAQTEH
jgi:cytoskeletal protein CcmA (bactofilin family)